MIVTLTGENDYLLKEKIDLFKTKYKDYENIDVLNLEIEDIKINLQNMSLFSINRCIILYQPSLNKDFKNNVEDILGNIPESTTLIIIENQFDKRSSYYKYLKQNSEFLEFNSLNNEQLKKWIMDYVKNHEGHISLNDSELLIQLLGDNQYLLKNEILKLLTFDSNISKETIETLIDPIPSSTTFELIDASLVSNLEKAFNIYDLQRSQKVEPQVILGMFIWQLHILALIKTYKGNPRDIYSELPIKPFVIDKSIRLSRNISLKKLKDLISYLKKADYESKTKYIELDQYLKNFLIKLSFN